MISQHYLLGQLVKRDVLLRYRGAMFGVLWVFLNPLIMLAIFAFVFGHIFQARWPEQQPGNSGRLGPAVQSGADLIWSPCLH